MGGPSFQRLSQVAAAFTVLIILAATGEAAARCSQKADFEAVAEGLSEELRCRTSALLGEVPGCTRPTYPACAGAMPDRVLELLLGPDTGAVSGWNPDSRRCQRFLARASSRFVGQRLLERGEGKRRSRAGRTMVRVAQRGCAQATVQSDATNHKVPRIGAPCSEFLGALGEPIEGGRLARCIRSVLEGEIDDIAPSALQPNILLVLTDDQRADFVEVMPFVRTLRDEGVHFRNAFTTNPVCTPSRASVLTGRYTHNNGVLSNGHFLFLDDSDTVAVWLEEAGYTNGLFGKYLNNTELLGPTPPQGWHEWKAFLDPSGGEFYGFRINDNGVSRSLGPNAYSTDWMRNQMLRFLRRQADEAFFAVFSPFAPHGPAEPARRHQQDFLEMAPYRPPSFLGELEGKPNWVKYYRGLATSDFISELDEIAVSRLQSLLAVDEAVEKILDRVEKLGLSDNTVVVFTSDHGFLLGGHWFRGKFNPYEESIRIPYLIRYPRRYPVPAVRDPLVLNHDLAPTFAELAQASVPADLDGESLVSILDSPTASWRKEFLIETLGKYITAPSESVRTERWKYIETFARAGVTEELYDLAADPYELVNLVEDPAHTSVVADMASRLAGLREP